jgi:hypothetical protein
MSASRYLAAPVASTDSADRGASRGLLSGRSSVYCEWVDFAAFGVAPHGRLEAAAWLGQV